MERSILPLAQTMSPARAEQVAELLRSCAASATAAYPLGGETALDYGPLPTRPGVGLSLRNLRRTVDYPHLDTTITVEAGMTLAELDDLVRPHNQRLPADAPLPERATLGGVIACHAAGPRRYRWGTIRDCVIGLTAIDGTGTTFRGGGRVVKNVAGYDLCRLMTGSLGTLGTIVQVSLKLIPRPESFAWLVLDLPGPGQAEAALTAVATTRTMPTAVELLVGPAWRNDPALDGLLEPLPEGTFGRLAVGVEGTAVEVAWQFDRLRDEWSGLAGVRRHRVEGAAAEGLYARIRDFATQPAPLVVKAVLDPDQVVRRVRDLCEADPTTSFQAHAGDGIVHIRFERCESLAVRLLLDDRLRHPIAATGGHVVVLSHQLDIPLTRDLWWGPPRPEYALMEAVRKQLDPHGILNPGRYVVSG